MKTICQMMEHLYWANRQLLSGLSGIRSLDRETMTLFRHIAAAEKIWLHRLEGRDNPHLSLWEHASISELEELVRENERNYKKYIAGLSEDRLDTWIEYKNMSGTSYRTSIRDILTHVALHGQYHRGQINRMLREQNEEPLSLDYIAFIRMKPMDS